MRRDRIEPQMHLDCTKQINCGYCKNVGIPCPQKKAFSNASGDEGTVSAREKKILAITGYASSAGFLGGLVYSFMKGKKFWGYVGFSLLGSLAFGTAANLIARPLIKK